MEAPKGFTDSDMQVMKQELEGESLISAVQKIKKYFEKIEKTELHIAVTGGSGKGKSTFINAIRGLGDEDEGSASTGVVETTMEPTPYHHPNFPNVKFWDLPGIGTENFRADQYLEKVKFHQYDFFIIISSDRFTSNDAKLAREIQRMKKHFYFIRSKIDESLRSEARKRDYNEKATLDKIKQDCITGLNELGLKSPKVFLISSYELEKYDFTQLQKELKNDLPQEKRHVLLLALPNITQSINRKKKELLLDDIWKVAFLSGTLRAVPIPGLGFSVDVSMLQKQISQYYKAFGLDEASLKSLSDHVKVPVEELKKAMKYEYDQEVTADTIFKLETKSTGKGLQAAGYFLSCIPFLAGGIAFITTYSMLEDCLDELAENSDLMLMRAFSSSV